jgi:hypothetical protein
MVCLRNVSTNTLHKGDDDDDGGGGGGDDDDDDDDDTRIFTLPLIGNFIPYSCYMLSPSISTFTDMCVSQRYTLITSLTLVFGTGSSAAINKSLIVWWPSTKFSTAGCRYIEMSDVNY